MWSAYAERVPHEWADFPVHWSGNSGPLLLASITIRRMVGALPRQRVDGDRIAVIDAGKSTLRAAAFAGGQMLARHDEPAGLPHPEAPGAQETVLGKVESVLHHLGHSPYCTLVLAATGIRGIGPCESRLRTALARRWDCEVLLVNDVVAAYLGTLGPRPGVLVQAGTGSLVLAVAEGRSPVLLDGWGHLAGDRGSGFALGQAGLRAAFRALDGISPPTALTAMLGADPEQTIRDLYASSTQTREVAALAPLVLQAAADADDAALAVIADVVCELVDMVLAAGRRLGDAHLTSLPVAVVGGLFADSLFRASVTDGLHERLPHVDLLVGAGDALQGGRLLATTSHDPFTRKLSSAFRNENS